MLISADMSLGMAVILDFFFFFFFFFGCWGGGGGGGMADIPYFFFLVNTRCWGYVYVADKIQSTPPPPSHPRPGSTFCGA